MLLNMPHTISKESKKRETKWGIKYFTHPLSYYPLPETGMSFQDAKLMTLLPANTLTKKELERPWSSGWKIIVQYGRDQWGATQQKIRQDLFLQQCELLQVFTFQPTKLTRRTLPPWKTARSVAQEGCAISFVSVTIVPQLDHSDVDSAEFDSEDWSLANLR